MIIDFHAHVASAAVLPATFFDSWAENICRRLPAGAREGVRRLLLQLNDDPDCSRLLAEMDLAGIDKAVLLIIDFGYSFPDEAVPLESLYRRHREVAAAHPDRFVVFGGIDPRRGDAGLELFERSVREWKFGGLKLYPPCGYSPSDRALFPYYELCRKYRLPVFTHLGPTASCLSFKHTRPEDVDDAAHAFPDVNFILGHAGVVLHEGAGLLAEYRPNIYLELSGFQTEIRRKGFVHILRRHRQRGTMQKLLFGTDWPIHRLLGGQKEAVEAILRAAHEVQVRPDELERILYGNAAELLGLTL
jgi:predicted TIM-barrel fold metal-dependent hydrolase